MVAEKELRVSGRMWRKPSIRLGQGYGFWFRIRGYGLAWSVVYPNYQPIFSERYSEQHGIPKRRVLYAPVWPRKRWRFEWLTP